MTKVPVYFDPEIELTQIIEAIRPMGWTLRGDHGRITVVPRDTERTRPSNVIPLRRSTP